MARIGRKFAQDVYPTRSGAGAVGPPGPAGPVGPAGAPGAPGVVVAAYGVQVTGRVSLVIGNGYHPPVYTDLLVVDAGAAFAIPLVGFTNGNRLAVQFSATVKPYDREMAGNCSAFYQIRLVTTSGTTVLGITGSRYSAQNAMGSAAFVWLTGPLVAEASMVVSVGWDPDDVLGGAISPFPATIFDGGLGHNIEDVDDPPSHASMMVWEVTP